MWGQNWGTLIWGGGISAAAASAGGTAATILLGLALAALAFWQLRHSRGQRLAAPFLLLLAVLVPVSVRALTLPFTFTNGTIANATQVNSNFEALRAGVSAVEGSGAAVVTAYDMNSFVNITPVGTRVPVKSISLPAGSYLVTATATAVMVNSGICELVKAAPGPALDTRAMSVGLLPNFVPQQEISLQMPITLQTDVTLSAPDTLTLQCVTFNTPTNSSLALQVRAARISAISVATRSVSP